MASREAILRWAGLRGWLEPCQTRDLGECRQRRLRRAVRGAVTESRNAQRGQPGGPNKERQQRHHDHSARRRERFTAERHARSWGEPGVHGAVSPEQRISRLSGRLPAQRAAPQARRAARSIRPAVSSSGDAPSPNTLSVVATSAEDSSRSASATVTITAQPTILSLLPSSITAGAAGGFTLRVAGRKLRTGIGAGPGSSILISGSPAHHELAIPRQIVRRRSVPPTLPLATSLSVTIQNPDGTMSNTVSVRRGAGSAEPGDIPLTPGRAERTGRGHRRHRPQHQWFVFPAPGREPERRRARPISTRHEHLHIGRRSGNVRGRQPRARPWPTSAFFP